MQEDSFQKAQVIAAYKRLFLNNADGKAILDDMAAKARLDQSTFDPNPNTSAYLQGKRDNVLELFAILNINVVSYLTENVTREDY